MYALNLDSEAIHRGFHNAGYECDIIRNGRVVNVYVLVNGAYERFGTATYVGNGCYEVYSLNPDYTDPVDTVKIN